MCDYDADILRLNEKIKQLLWRVEQSDFEKSSNNFCLDTRSLEV